MLLGGRDLLGEVRVQVLTVRKNLRLADVLDEELEGRVGYFVAMIVVTIETYSQRVGYRANLCTATTWS